MSPVLLEVNDLKKHFPLRGSLLRPGGRRVYAVDGVSFQIDKAETLALVGRIQLLVAHCLHERVAQRRDPVDLWSYDGTLDRTHHALYVACREQGEREASPTAAIIDSQSAKSENSAVCVSLARVSARMGRES